MFYNKLNFTKRTSDCHTILLNIEATHYTLQLIWKGEKTKTYIYSCWNNQLFNKII
jgi:hypothetical protein